MGEITFDASDLPRIIPDASLESGFQGVLEAPIIVNISDLVAQSDFPAGGMAGDISINANTVLNVRNGGVIEATTNGGLNAGSITLNVGQLLAENGARITSSSLQGATGNAGEIRIQGAGGLGTEASLVTLSAAELATKADSSNGGRIIIRAHTLVQQHDSVINAEVGTGGGSGIGGDIDIEAGMIELTDGARIVTESSGEGDAGRIRMNAQQTLLIDESEVSTSAAQADGGDMVIKAEFIQLRNGKITTTVRSSEGRGGNITIDTNLGLLEHSDIRADAFGGPGGNITIQADGFITDVDSVVSASSTQSVDGTVSIQGLADPHPDRPVFRICRRPAKRSLHRPPTRRRHQPLYAGWPRPPPHRARRPAAQPLRHGRSRGPACPPGGGSPQPGPARPGLYPNRLASRLRALAQRRQQIEQRLGWRPQALPQWLACFQFLITNIKKPSP